jgi:cell division protein YceG involved in septum cleavage
MTVRPVYNYVYPFVFVVSLTVFFLLQVSFFNGNYRNETDDAMIKITRGDNLRTVATKLEESQIIFSKYIFIGIGRILGYQEKLIPGEYKFQNGLTYFNILKTLTDPYIIRTVTKMTA